MESHRRSIAKALSWRVAATIITACVAWWVTGRPESAAEIALADTLVKLVVYYSHERLWNHIRFGRPKPPEYQI